jgi:hypothetical protein
MSIVHVEGFGHRGGATGMALEYTLAGGGTLTETTMTARRPDCFAASCPDVSITKLIALSGASVVTGFAFQWTSGASSAGDICRILDADESTIHLTLNIDTDGELRIYRGDSATGTELYASGTTVLTSGVPYYIEISATIDNSAGVVRLDCSNSGPSTMLTGTDTQNGGTASIGGVRLYGPTAGALFADWYIMDGADGGYTTRLGDIRVDCYLPYTDSQWDDWTPSTGSQGYLVVDETTPNSDTDYLSTSTAGHRHFFQFGPMDHDPTAVRATRIIATARKDDSGDRSIKLGYVSDMTFELEIRGTTMEDAVALTTSYDVYDWIDNDDGGYLPSFSTQALFNGTAFGVEVA